MTELVESLESLARLLEAPKKNKFKRKLLVVAALGFDKRGKPINPAPILIGDELRLQDPHQPAAGMLSRNPAGRPFGLALQALAAGLTAELETELYEKHWIVDGDPCEECDENGLAGWLAIDEDYPNEGEPGDIHPNCRCTEIVRRSR